MSPSLTAASLLTVKDWVVVVTGGGTGIGLMYAQALAANGAKVYITGRRQEVLEQSARVHGSADKIGSSGGQIVPLVMDVTNKDSIKDAVKHVTETDGYVNVLVNNAGVWTTKPEAGPEDGPEKFGSSMFDQSIDLWQQAFLVNATSIYFVTAAFLPLLAKSVSSPTGKMGSVINTTSNSGQLRMSEGSQLAYNVSKAASVQMTRQLAFDFSHDNIKIRVNGIAPGWFPSEMTTGGSDDNNESTSQEDSAFQQEMLGIGARVPPGRMGKPEDLASGLLMLATNDYIWGMNLVIDGGILQSVAGNI
ncbi:Gluconate 5-dehydrogenase 3 [Colletotrichum chlorophyti]|uniref:Gluconate 5-dehydrogenase 3 n=1 Tax=Colletotrichum chlorophyti TaxID=708187 RepID=A0A1Q8RN02_9PEZI|nr:Gluconate 5-dehydrogenase 3 [Colletotrichum chlorophyti]